VSVVDQMRLALVVGGDQIVRATICHVLQAAGYRAKTIDSLSHALVLIEHNAPEVMFSELALSDGSGLSLVLESRLLRPTLKIVLMAHQPSAAISIEAMRSGVSDILLAPVTASAVTAALFRVPKVERRRLAASTAIAARAVEPNADRVSIRLDGGLKHINKMVVQAALRRYGGNKSAAARALSIPRRSLYRLLGEK
jgi:DNA-binding NtrC family response regulator